MSLAQLTDELTDPKLKTFVSSWDIARGDREVPRWRDLDVAAMKHVLPFVWAWVYDRENDVFTGKLAGEEILSVVGRGLRGAKAHEFYTPAQYQVFYGWTRRVVVDQVGLVISGQVFSFVGSAAVGQRVALPVAVRGERADTILGVTLFDFSQTRAMSIRNALTFEAINFHSLER